MPVELYPWIQLLPDATLDAARHRPVLRKFYRASPRHDRKTSAMSSAASSLQLATLNTWQTQNNQSDLSLTLFIIHARSITSWIKLPPDTAMLSTGRKRQIVLLPIWKIVPSDPSPLVVLESISSALTWFQDYITIVLKAFGSSPLLVSVLNTRPRQQPNNLPWNNQTTHCLAFGPPLIFITPVATSLAIEQALSLRASRPPPGAST